MTISVLPAIVTTLVGAPGTVRGVTAVEGADAEEFPAAFIATTVKVYERPFVNPVYVHVKFNVFTQSTGAATDGEDVTV